MAASSALPPLVLGAAKARSEPKAVILAGGSAARIEDLDSQSGRSAEQTRGSTPFSVIPVCDQLCADPVPFPALGDFVATI